MKKRTSASKGKSVMTVLTGSIKKLMAKKKTTKKKEKPKTKLRKTKARVKISHVVHTKLDTLNHISCEGVRIVYKSPDTPWIVGCFRDRDFNQFIATGEISFPGAGEHIELQGEWKDNDKYGKQFAASGYYTPRPSSIGGLVTYLVNQIEGIGQATAEAIVAKFGVEGTSNVITSDYMALTAFRGISEAKAIKIHKSWHSQEADRNISIYLANKGISVARKYDILHTFPAEKAISILENNPYELTKVPRIGFITADEIARKAGYTEDCPERVEAACVFCLEQAANIGHCFLNEGDVIESVRSMTGRDEAFISNAITILLAQGKVKIETIANPNTPDVKFRLIYLPYLYNSEVRLSKNIREILKSPVKRIGSIKSLIDDFEKESNTHLSSRQREAVQNAFDNKLSIITGAPGTGKTQTIRAIIYVADKLNVKYQLSAPTGRASRRIAEVTGAPAQTMHKLLEYQSEKKFNRDRANPLETGVLIVDEFSMPDLVLANSLFDAINSGTHTILVGDVDQLPAVGPGTVLKDLIAYGKIPTTVLDTVFRQAGKSLIVQNAHKIRQGQPPVFLPKGTEADSYSMTVPRRTHANGSSVEDVDWVKRAIVDLVKVHIPKHMSKEPGFSPIRDIQIVVPMKKGTVGVYELNYMLREELNKDSTRFFIGKTEWRIGDRVMQMVNNYDLDVSNGDVGFIRSHDPINKEVLIEFYNTKVTLNYKDMQDIDLAYASTVHKVQGSEYPVVIIVMLWQHRPMLEKNLLYTANTRARKMAMYVTSPGVMQFAVENIKVEKRNSFLMQRLAVG
jgi:exodeoxyribonuclease V alpha subunit